MVDEPAIATTQGGDPAFTNYLAVLGKSCRKTDLEKLFDQVPQPESDDAYYFWLNYEEGAVELFFDLDSGAFSGVEFPENGGTCTSVTYHFGVYGVPAFAGVLPFNLPNPPSEADLLNRFGPPVTVDETPEHELVTAWEADGRIISKKTIPGSRTVAFLPERGVRLAAELSNGCLRAIILTNV